jgi:hypothetical protein
MENIGSMSVAAITVICYLGALIVKATSINNKWIPVFCGVIGAFLGVVSLYVMPDFPANDIVTSLAVGVTSGLAATGADQVYKQMTKDDGTEDA